MRRRFAVGDPTLAISRLTDQTSKHVKVAGGRPRRRCQARDGTVEDTGDKGIRRMSRDVLGRPGRRGGSFSSAHVPSQPTHSRTQIPLWDTETPPGVAGIGGFRSEHELFWKLEDGRYQRYYMTSRISLRYYLRRRRKGFIRTVMSDVSAPPRVRLLSKWQKWETNDLRFPISLRLLADIHDRPS